MIIKHEFLQKLIFDRLKLYDFNVILHRNNHQKNPYSADHLFNRDLSRLFTGV